MILDYLKLYITTYLQLEDLQIWNLNYTKTGKKLSYQEVKERFGMGFTDVLYGYGIEGE